tara:strand:- start:774 stop:1838 length:1065 start_codon:yes stop_codon:yes gene_type:complete
MEEVRRYSIGSLFAGIGGFELGLERAIPGAFTQWQVEQNTYCQKVLAKHWPDARIYDDVRNITKNNVEQVDILCGGFPCQDISLAGKGEGLHGKKSGLWWEMHRIIDELQPRAVIMENVAAINVRGLGTVLGSLSEIGYDAEWCTIRASDFGAPHRRSRWFCIAYPTHYNRSTKAEPRTKSEGNRKSREGYTSGTKIKEKREECRGRETLHNFRYPNISSDPTKNAAYSKGITGFQTNQTTGTIREGRYSRKVTGCSDRRYNPTNTNSERIKKQSRHTKYMEQKQQSECRSSQTPRPQQNYWKGFPTQSPVCRRDDGVPNRVDRLRALGNAIVPQCSEWIGRKLWESGILQAGD